MLKHAQRTRKMRGLPRPNFRRTRFLSQSWPARINETSSSREAAPSYVRRISPLLTGGIKRESGVSLEFEDMFPRASTSQVELSAKTQRLSFFSDTSSAYSGSDHMTSSQSLMDAEDFSDLVESSVDSDGDDLSRSMESLTCQDTLKDCLEKDPSERTEKDLEMLLDFTKHLEAFSKMTLAVQRDICNAMVFAVVESADTELLQHDDEMDSWCVIVNGSVEVTHPNGQTQKLHVGDSFGVEPSLEKARHIGVMRTCCDDCQFVCVPQNDYYCILYQGEETISRLEEGGRVVLVTELRGERHVVIQGTPEKLIKQLVEDKPAYIEDFLLTYRTFIDDPLKITTQLQRWFDDPRIKDCVARVVMFWVKNHLNDFETNPEMMAFLEGFVSWLEQEKMKGELNMLTTLLEANTRTRTMVLTRSSRDETLQISIKGGCDQCFGIFISQVDKNSKAETVGFLRGDQILEVNGQNFETSPVSHEQALKVLRDSTHLSITVKSNLIVFKELLQVSDTSRRRCGRVSVTTTTPSSVAMLPHGASLPSRAGRHNNKEKWACGTKSRLHRALTHFGQPLFTFLAENPVISINLLESRLYSKLFNDSATAPPDQNGDVTRSTFTMHSLKVYRVDQSFKYVVVNQETTAQETVQLALQEFGLPEPSSGYFLCEVSVAEGGFVKQSRLPDQLHNLAERIGVNSRYYLKACGSTEPLVPDELVPELVKESKVYFLQLNSAQVAIQLTLQDFSIFKQIEKTEYVDQFFKLESRYGTPVLSRFAELANREMFWVITEICSEMNVVRRSKIIKQFIKLARQCKVCNNFNSMFAILSGLRFRSVSRLKLSWERVPAKYQKMFSDLEDFIDPSRNMSKYRQYVLGKMYKHPIIPLYPLVSKDLTFVNEGNSTYIDGLINFDKLRKFAEVVRSLSGMCSCPYDLFTSLEQGGQSSYNAIKSLNLNLTSVCGQTTEDTTMQKRRKTSPAALNARKLFDEAQMVRRVKEYLNNIRVITDEEQLYVMSLMCEPPLRKRQPSPGPSSGRDSPAGSKIMMDSTLTARKLQSLSEPIKTSPLPPRGAAPGGGADGGGGGARRPGSCAPSQGGRRRESAFTLLPAAPTASSAACRKRSVSGVVHEDAQQR